MFIHSRYDTFLIDEVVYTNGKSNIFEMFEIEVGLFIYFYTVNISMDSKRMWIHNLSHNQKAHLVIMQSMFFVNLIHT